MKRLLLLILIMCGGELTLLAQTAKPSTVVATCGAQSLTAGQPAPQYVDTTGNLCGPGSGVAAVVKGNGTAGSADSSPITVQGIASMTPILVTPSPVVTGGCTPATPIEVAASDNHQTVVTGQHQLCHIDAFNSGTVVQFIRLYDAASGFNGCNSASNLKWEGQIPANSSAGSGFVLALPQGLQFASGISVCVTGAFGNTDTTSATASKTTVNLSYK